MRGEGQNNYFYVIKFFNTFDNWIRIMYKDMLDGPTCTSNKLARSILSKKKRFLRLEYCKNLPPFQIKLLKYFYNIVSRAQCYINFYSRNSCVFVIR